MQHLEYKLTDVTFVRVDSETIDNLVQKDEQKESVLSEEEENKVKEVFEGLAKESGGTVMMKALSPQDQPIQITRPEFMRRMKEMQALQGMNMDNLPEMYNVVVNSNHPLIAEKVLNEKDDAKQKELAGYLFNLARLNHNMLKGSEMTAFINKSLEFLK